jgi:hypothetical protein
MPTFCISNIILFVFSIINIIFSFLVSNIYFTHWKQHILPGYAKNITLGISLSSFGLGMYHIGHFFNELLCIDIIWTIMFLISSIIIISGYYFTLSPYIINMGFIEVLHKTSFKIITIFLTICLLLLSIAIY